MDITGFEAAGLYDHRAPGAAQRLGLLRWLAGRGVTLERMERALRDGQLVGLAGDLALRPEPRYTTEEAARRSGLSVEQLRQLGLAAGFATRAPGGAVYGDTDVEMFATFVAAATMFGELAVRRFVRTLASSLGRIAEAAMSLYLVNVEGPLMSAGATELELAQQNLRAIESLDAVELCLRHLFRLHLESATRRMRQSRRARSVDTLHLTVGFVDLVGFTSLSRRLDTRDLADLINRFEETAYDVVTAHEGRVVKLIGDEVMFVAVDAAAACDIALTLVEHFAGDPSVTPRGGLAAGDLLFRGGDYYGPVVNLASRVAQLAVPHELLVTTEVAAEVHTALRFEPAGRRMLKGFDEPVVLLTVARA